MTHLAARFNALLASLHKIVDDFPLLVLAGHRVHEFHLQCGRIAAQVTHRGYSSLSFIAITLVTDTHTIVALDDSLGLGLLRVDDHERVLSIMSSDRKHVFHARSRAVHHNAMLCILVFCNTHVESVQCSQYDIRIVVDKNGGIVCRFLKFGHRHG